MADTKKKATRKRKPAARKPKPAVAAETATPEVTGPVPCDNCGGLGYYEPPGFAGFIRVACIPCNGIGSVDPAADGETADVAGGGASGGQSDDGEPAA